MWGERDGGGDPRAVRPGPAAQHGTEEPFPEAALSRLARLGAGRLYVPVQDGGDLRCLTELVRLWRDLADGDMTVAVAHGKTFLGAVCVWLAGSAAQRRFVRGLVEDGVPVAWGLTERNHGADLMATETAAVPTADGWSLDGEKWLVNNATRARVMTVLARTDGNRGARNLSLFLVDKRALPDDRWSCLDKIATHGVRGADISGIRFHGAGLPRDAVVGGVGDGLELTLKGLQLTRTAVCGLSLGVLDAAVRTTARFAASHVLYGRRLIDLDLVQERLSQAVVALWLGEVAVWVAARSAAVLPGEMSVVSCLVKGAVPSLVAAEMSGLEEQMGARGFVGDLPGSDGFEKRVRDHQLVPIFDGSTLVSRTSVVPHLAGLVRRYEAGACDRAGLAAVAGRAAERIDFGGLSLLSRTGCSVVQAIPSLVDALLSDPDRLDGEARDAVALFGAGASRVMRGLAEAEVRYPDVPVATLEGIARYEWLFIGASCLLVSSSAPGGPRGEPTLDAALDRSSRHWLAPCLRRVNRELADTLPDDGAGLSPAWLKADLARSAPGRSCSLMFGPDARGRP